MPKWRNWQTRMVQVHVPARAWGFESLLRHHLLVASLPNRWRALLVQCVAKLLMDGRGARVGPLHFLREQTFSAPLYCSELFVSFFDHRLRSRRGPNV